MIPTFEQLADVIRTHFGVRLTDHTGYATRFALAQGETLFSGEGLGFPMPRTLRALLGAPPEHVRDPSVGELHAALMVAARDTPHKDSRC